MIGRTPSTKRLSPPGCQNLPALESAASTASCGRQQHGIDAGIRDLLRHQLPVAHVALQRRAVAVEEHDDHAGLADVEILRDVHQDAVVVEGLVLPEDPAAVAAVAAPLAVGNVQERLVGARIVAEIGERRGFQADQRGLILAGRALIRHRRRQRRHPVGRRAAACAVRSRRGVVEMDAAQRLSLAVGKRSLN